MTFFVKCDNCGKEQEAECNNLGEPLNPINDETGVRWYNATKDGKTQHACCHDHIPKDGLVWPV